MFACILWYEALFHSICPYGVVVITFASHAKGPRFDTEYGQLFHFTCH